MMTACNINGDFGVGLRHKHGRTGTHLSSLFNFQQGAVKNGSGNLSSRMQYGVLPYMIMNPHAVVRNLGHGRVVTLNAT